MILVIDGYLIRVVGSLMIKYNIRSMGMEKTHQRHKEIEFILSSFKTYPYSRPFFALQLALHNSHFFWHLSPPTRCRFVTQIYVLANSHDLLWKYHMTIFGKLQKIQNSNNLETKTRNLLIFPAWSLFYYSHFLGKCRYMLLLTSINTSLVFTLLVTLKLSNSFNLSRFLLWNLAHDLLLWSSH